MSTLDHVFSLIRFSHFTQHLSSCIYVIRSTQCRVQTMYVVCYFFPFFCVSIYFYSLFIFKACSPHSCVCIVWASFACLKSVLTAFLCRMLVIFVVIVVIMMMILLVMIMMIIYYVIISFCFYHAF